MNPVHTLLSCFNIISLSFLRGLIPSDCLPKLWMHIYSLPWLLHASPIFFPWFDHSHIISRAVKIIKLLIMKFSPVSYHSRSRDSVIGIATGSGWPRGRGSSPGRVKNFLFSTSSRSTLGSTQPSMQCVLGALSTGVKRPGLESDLSPPVTAAVKKTWTYISAPSYAFKA
jgi:hypothetical protein